MKNSTFRFSISIIVFFTFLTPFCRAQGVETNLDIDSADMAKIRAEMRQQEKEMEALRQHFDSLFLKKEYKKIISECESRSSDVHLSAIVRYNLIAAYFFAGDVVLSRKLIQKELSKYSSGIAASTLLSENYTGYLYFLINNKNWEYVEKCVKEIAMEDFVVEKITQKEKGIQLFDFFLADQKNRLFYDYTAENRDVLYKYKNYKTKRAFEKEVEQICKDVFEFYKKEGKLFSKNEIGELHYIQLVFLLHDSNPERRAYYLEILSNAVSSGVFPIDKKIDFLIVNELIKVDWKNMTKVVTEQENKFRKEYELPNYKFSLVM